MQILSLFRLSFFFLHCNYIGGPISCKTLSITAFKISDLSNSPRQQEQKARHWPGANTKENLNNSRDYVTPITGEKAEKLHLITHTHSFHSIYQLT